MTHDACGHGGPAVSHTCAPEPRRRCAIRRLLGASVVSSLLVGISTGAVLVVTTATANAFTCGNSTHYYGAAESGSGTNWGTAIDTNMPGSYYAPSGQASDEGVFMLAGSSTLELGWMTGTFPVSGPDYGNYYTSPVGYQTFGDGASGSVLTSALPENTQLAFDITDPDNSSNSTFFIAKTGSPCTTYYDGSSSWTVSTPRTNFAQGEVQISSGGTPTAWMGGNSGGGTTSWGYYYPTGSLTEMLWGSIALCHDSPYWIDIIGNSTYEYKNGGS